MRVLALQSDNSSNTKSRNSNFIMEKFVLKYWWALIILFLIFAVIFDALILTSYEILLTIVLGIMLLLCVGIEMPILNRNRNSMRRCIVLKAG